MRLAGTIDAIADRVAPANVASGPRAAARPVRRAGRRPSDAAGCPRRCWRGADRRPGRVAAHPVSPPRGVGRYPGRDKNRSGTIAPARVEDHHRRTSSSSSGVASSPTRATLARVLETSHPPVFYVPYADIADGVSRRRRDPRTASSRARLATTTSPPAIVRTDATWHFPRHERRTAPLSITSPSIPAGWTAASSTARR